MRCLVTVAGSVGVRGYLRAMAVTIRPANDDDATTIARIWHEAWGDGHRGNVPAHWSCTVVVTSSAAGGRAGRAQLDR